LRLSDWMCDVLQIYQEAFETRFLESTEELYHAEGQMLIEEWEVSELHVALSLTVIARSLLTLVHYLTCNHRGQRQVSVNITCPGTY